MHFTQILLRTLLFWCAMLANRQRYRSVAVVYQHHLRRERERERESFFSRACLKAHKRFEEQHCFTKHSRLASHLAACLSAQITIHRMPDNHESLICQLVGWSIGRCPLRNTTCQRRKNQFCNVCALNTAYSSVFRSRLLTNPTKLQLQHCAHSMFFRINRIFVVKTLWIRVFHVLRHVTFKCSSVLKFDEKLNVSSSKIEWISSKIHFASWT